MSRASKIPCCLALACAALASSAWGQREPRVGYVYPAGGRQSTTFEAVIGGQYLNNATNVFASGSGVSAMILRQERQLTPKEQQEVKEKLSKFQERRKSGERLTPEEAKSVEEMKALLTAFGRRLSNPALGEFVTLQVSVAANAAPGRRELRLATPTGLSNPLAFYVGVLPERSKPDWKAIPKGRASMDAKIDATPPPVDIALPITLNGQIPPGGVDRYRFHGRAGQPLVVSVSARELIPYLADAVPGWFQATLTLYDAKGGELAYDDDYRFHPDPVLFFKIPSDGEYVLEIKDSLFRGREDFVYRISVGELPFISGIFPLGGRTGAETTIELAGWNLPTNRATLDLKGVEAGQRPVFVSSATRLSNTAPFAVDTLPECLEKEPNDSADKAQPAVLPVIVNGRIGRPGDLDVFRVDGRAGDRIVAEVMARRLDSPLDSVLKLTDAAGRQIAFNDDFVDKGSGLNTHHADSYLSATLPSNGCYFVRLGDTQQGGGAAYSYRLRLGAPRPDFELRIAPSTLNVRGGASAPLTAYALRKDGFDGQIGLSLKDAPDGFTLSTAHIPATQDQVRLTLTASPSSPTKPSSLHIEGRAMIGGREVVRSAVPADDRTQAFAYRHLVPADELKVAVVGRFRPRSEARILSPIPIKIPAGGTALLLAHVPTGPLMDSIEFELSDPPDGITIKEVSKLPEGSGILLHADAAIVTPGLQGNLIVNASSQRLPRAGEDQPPANMRRIPMGSLPAIPFEVTPP
jgi:hypothetical protein